MSINTMTLNTKTQKVLLARRAASTLAAALLLLTPLAYADDIKVIASAAFKEAYLELVPAFEKASGHKVITIWAGGVDIVKRIEGGELVDVVIIARPPVEALIKQGKLAAGSRVDLAKSGVGVAVRAGAPRPDISSADALKRALLAAKSIAYSSGPSGAHIAALIKRMGIEEEVKAKVFQTKPGNPVGNYVARGEAEIGFQQLGELMPIAGIDLLGPLPAEVQEITVFSGAVHAAAKSAVAARALLEFFASPAAAPVIMKKGMTPG